MLLILMEILGPQYIHLTLQLMYNLLFQQIWKRFYDVLGCLGTVFDGFEKIYRFSSSGKTKSTSTTKMVCVKILLVI